MKLMLKSIVTENRPVDVEQCRAMRVVEHRAEEAALHMPCGLANARRR